MSNDEIKDHLRFCIERYDHYYDSVNNKSAVFLGINTFIVGGLVAAYPSITAIFNCGTWINFFITAVVGTGLCSIFVTLLASIPFLSPPGNSNIYFGSISSKQVAAFRDSLRVINNDKVAEDFIEQAHTLATGLNRKFKRLQWAGYLVFMEFILSVPLILLLLNNLKSTL